MGISETAKALSQVQNRPEPLQMGRLDFWKQRFFKIHEIVDNAHRDLERFRALSRDFEGDAELNAVAYRRGRMVAYEAIKSIEHELSRLERSLAGKGEVDERA